MNCSMGHWVFKITAFRVQNVAGHKAALEAESFIYKESTETPWNLLAIQKTKECNKATTTFGTMLMNMGCFARITQVQKSRPHTSKRLSLPSPQAGSIFFSGCALIPKQKLRPKIALHARK